MDKLRKTLIGLSALMLIFSVFSFPVCALEASRIELVTDSGEYKKGELVKAQIHIYNAEFNTAGFALDYDTSVMGAVTAAGRVRLPVSLFLCMTSMTAMMKPERLVL